MTEVLIPIRRALVRQSDTLRRLGSRARAQVTIRRHREILSQAKRFVVFVGYPRSSHSLLGALLDAHPDMVVSHELDALAYVNVGVRRDTLFGLVLDRERWFGRRQYEWSGYSYEVPGEWQGRIRVASVVGDKRGGNTTRWLARDATLLDQLEKLVEVPVHVIHVVRNPYDNVARMALTSSISDPAEALEKATADYLRLGRAAHQVRATWDADRWFDLANEQLCAEPRHTLSGLCRFLGVACPDDWLASTSSMVFDEPRAARREIEWPPDLVRRLARQVDELECVKHYPQDVLDGPAP